MSTIKITPVAGEVLAGAASFSAVELRSPLALNSTGGNLSKGAAVYPKADGSWGLAKADDADEHKVSGFLVGTVSEGATERAITSGFTGTYLLDAASAAVVNGSKLYLSATEAGKLSTVAPGVGEYSVFVGNVAPGGLNIEINMPIIL